MTLLHAMFDGAMVAAELLALLFVSPAVAQEPATLAAAAALDRPVQVHRWSTTVDVRLLGSLANVRVAHAVRNVSPATVNLASHLPPTDEHVDALCVMHPTRAAELLRAGECREVPADGHVRLTEDERIADALQLAPGAGAVIEVFAAQPLAGSGRSYRVTLPVPLDADRPRLSLFDQDGSGFLLLVPHRAAQRATLVLRPANGGPEAIQLGAIDTRYAVLVPLANRSQLGALRDGAIELELVDTGATTWLTLAVDGLDDRPALHTVAD